MPKLRIIDWESEKADKLYKTYLSYRSKYEEQMGGKLFQEDPLSKRSYIILYNAAKREQAEDIAAGRRGGRTNLARELASRERYFLSGKEMRGYLRIAREAGRTDITMKTLKSVSSRGELREPNALGIELSKKYHQLKEENPAASTKEIQEWISEYYFDSPK